MEDENTKMSKDKFTLVNHASVLIESGESSILSDPWYFGSAFNNGWALLFENDENQILDILSRTKFIWISHEHPDHFSVPFFFKYKNYMIDNDIKILFQKTKDGRVKSFLSKQGLEVIDLENGKELVLDDYFKVRCVKSGFYDSALIIQTAENRILNLNDCPLREDKELTEWSKKLGQFDILFSQFSYAAWKGGKDNVEWRKSAADEKIKILKDQANAFGAKIIVPFASFVKFCSKYNEYLNDSHNTPPKVIENFRPEGLEVSFPMVMQTYTVDELYKNKDGLEFWEQKFDAPNLHIEDNLESVKFSQLFINNNTYQERVLKNNNAFLMKILKFIGILDAFKSVNIKLYDIGTIVKFEFFQELQELDKDSEYDIEMHSNSLNFIFKNPFGFDTLTVNGCFEENNKGAFFKMTKNFAVENLNNLGVPIGFSAIFNFRFIEFFFTMLARVRNNIT